jgi:hypothetical protein
LDNFVSAKVARNTPRFCFSSTLSRKKKQLLRKMVDSSTGTKKIVRKKEKSNSGVGYSSVVMRNIKGTLLSLGLWGRI